MSNAHIAASAQVARRWLHRRSGRIVSTVLLLAASIGVGMRIGVAIPRSTVTPQTVSGAVTFVGPDNGGSPPQFTFRFDSGATEILVLPDSIPWEIGSSAGWHLGGRPPCMSAFSHGRRRVTLGIVNVASGGYSGVGPLVVWVRCSNRYATAPPN